MIAGLLFADAAANVITCLDALQMRCRSVDLLLQMSPRVVAILILVDMLYFFGSFSALGRPNLLPTLVFSITNLMLPDMCIFRTVNNTYDKPNLPHCFTERNYTKIL